MVLKVRKKQTYFIKRTLYTLKQGYGFPITLHKITGETYDYEIGERIPTIKTQKINKAIMLPATQQYKFETDSLPRDFKYGALYDTALKRVVIDAEDLNDFEIEEDDYFIWDGKRWQVAKIINLEYQTGFVIFVRMVEGTPRHMVEEINIETPLRLSQTVT